MEKDKCIISSQKLEQLQNASKQVRDTMNFQGRDTYLRVLYRKYVELHNKIRIRGITEPAFYTLEGDAGIGKSYLIEYLCQCLDNMRKEDADVPEYICVELNENSDKISILYDLSKQIKEKCNISNLSNFDTAYANYTGTEKEKNGLRAFISGSTPGDFTMEFGSAVISSTNPISSIFTALKVIEKAVPLVSDIATAIESINVDNEIKISSRSTLYNNMHLYFIKDMYKVMQTRCIPLIIFFDNYEAYITHLKGEQHIFDDKWLREELGSLMLSVPNLLWVFSGRDQLNYNRYPANNDQLDLIKQNNYTPWESKLTALSNTDAETYLRKEIFRIEEEFMKSEFSINVRSLHSEKMVSTTQKQVQLDDNLIHHLVTMSGGFPIILKMCIEQYQNIRMDGKEPTVTDFDIDYERLYYRYFRYIDSNIETRDALLFLAGLGKWTDEEALCLGRDFMYNKYRWAKVYEKIKKTSFIKFHKTYYVISDVAKNVYRTAAGNEMICEINRRLLNYRLEKLGETTSAIVDYSKYTEDINDIVDVLASISEISKDWEKEFSLAFDKVIEHIKNICEYNWKKLALKLSKKLCSYCNTYFEGSVFEFKAKLLQSAAWISDENYFKAKKELEEAFVYIDNLNLREKEEYKEVLWETAIRYMLVLCAVGEYSHVDDIIGMLLSSKLGIEKKDSADFAIVRWLQINMLHKKREYKDALTVCDELLPLLENLPSENVGNLRIYTQLKKVELQLLQNKYEKSISNLEEIQKSYAQMIDKDIELEYELLELQCKIDKYLCQYERLIENREKIYRYYYDKNPISPITYTKLRSLAREYSDLNQLEQALIYMYEAYKGLLTCYDDKHHRSILECMSEITVLLLTVINAPNFDDIINKVKIKNIILSLHSIYKDDKGHIVTKEFCYDVVFGICDYIIADNVIVETSDLLILNTMVIKTGCLLIKNTLHEFREEIIWDGKKIYERICEVTQDEKHPDAINALHLLARIYDYVGAKIDISYKKKALDYFEKILDIIGKKHPNAISIMKDISNIYIDLKMDDNICEKLLEYVELLEEVPNRQSDLLHAYKNIVTYSKNENQITEYYQKLYELCERVLSNPMSSVEFISFALECKRMYAVRQKITTAEELLKEIYIYAISLHEKNPDEDALFNTLIYTVTNLGSIYWKQEDFENAADKFLEHLSLDGTKSDSLCSIDFATYCLYHSNRENALKLAYENAKNACRVSKSINDSDTVYRLTVVAMLQYYEKGDAYVTYVISRLKEALKMINSLAYYDDELRKYLVVTISQLENNKHPGSFDRIWYKWLKGEAPLMQNVSSRDNRMSRFITSKK